MAVDNISPEERLFKVIQGQKGGLPGEGGHKEKKRLIDIRAIKQFFVDIRGRIAKGGIGQKIGAGTLSLQFHEIDIKLVNKILIGIAVILTMTEIYYIIDRKPDIAKITKALSNIQIQETMMKGRTVEGFKPISYYIDEMKKRDMFSLGLTGEKGAPSKSTTTVSGLKEMAKDLKLKGISWGKSPKAMIGNEKEGKVYFLGEEQVIGSTGIEVKTILKHKVVISYNDEEMELM